jgi:hypothetical protein
MPALDVSRYRLDPPEKVNTAWQRHIFCFVSHMSGQWLCRGSCSHAISSTCFRAACNYRCCSAILTATPLTPCGATPPIPTNSRKFLGDR